MKQQISLSWQCYRAGLTEKQKRIVMLWSSGLQDAEVAEEVGIAIPTVRTYYNRLAAKFEARNKTNLIHLIWSYKLLGKQK